MERGRGRDVRAERMGEGEKGKEKGTERERNKNHCFCQFFFTPIFA